jgi:hypothetical protein
MKNSSLLARIARMTLVTGLSLTALILLATYASIMGSRKNINSAATAPDTYRGNEMSTGSAGIMAYSPGIDQSDADTTTVSATASLEQKVIKTAALDIEAASATTATSAIDSIAVAHQGFVQYSSVNEDLDGRHTADITIRVPSSEFGAVMTEIKALATRINVESISGQDVTEQYTDIAARLTAAKAQEEQYLLILAQAKTVGEVLAVQEHLADVRAQIESLQGQVNYLENRTSLATITIAIHEEPHANVPTNDKFDLGRDANAALAFVIALGQKVLSILVWILIVGLAVGIPIGLIALAARAIMHRGAPDKRRR